MTIENGQGLGEPALSPDAAKALLVHTGRAESSAKGGLNVDLTSLDTVGRAAVQIVLSGQLDTLSGTIRQMTNREPVLSSAVLIDIATEAVARHTALEMSVAAAA